MRKISCWKITVSLVLSAAALLLMACQPPAESPGTGNGDGNGNGATNGTGSASSASVSMSNFAFVPDKVTIAAGGTVTWTNKDPVTHDVVSDTGAFKSSGLTNNATFSHTFTEPGTYPYHCTPHPYMKATVIVE